MLSSKTGSERKTKKAQMLVSHKTEWKNELLKFQLQDEKTSFVDLKIKCTDGYFLAHKIVFAMCSQIKWEEKNSRCMDVWIVNHTLEETAKIMFLAYTGEILLVNNWTFLNELVKIFQLSEEQLNWGVPYNENNNLFFTLAQKRIRATKCCSSSDTQEEILIYGNGDTKYLRELEAENTKTSPYFQNNGYPCPFCSCIFMDETDFTEHEVKCRPQMVLKTEPPSPGSSSCAAQDPVQKRLAVSPEEMKCFVCNHENNSVMQLVDHFHTVHDVIPGKNYCMNPIRCNRCLFSRSGRNMSAFLYHVSNCKTKAGTNLNSIFNEITDENSSKLAAKNDSPPIMDISVTPTANKKRKREVDRIINKRKLNTKTETLKIPLPKNDTKGSSLKHKKKVITSVPTPIVSSNSAEKQEEIFSEGKQPTLAMEENISTNILISLEKLDTTILLMNPKVSKNKQKVFDEEKQPTLDAPENISTDTILSSIESLNTTIPMMNPKIRKDKAPKFIIPKKAKMKQIATDISIPQCKSLENGKTQIEKYHNPLKTPENPEKSTFDALFHGVRKRLESNENNDSMESNTEARENIIDQLGLEGQTLTISPNINFLDCSVILKEKCHEQLTPRKYISNVPSTSNDISRRLLFLSNTPTTLQTMVNTDDKNSNVHAAPLTRRIESNLRTTAPKRKKQKTSVVVNSLHAPNQQQVFKEQIPSLKKPVTSTSTPAKINIPQPSTVSSSKYKWLCSYCRSKFKSQIFYMRHNCCKIVTFPTKRGTFGKQALASYISKSKRGPPVPGTKKNLLR